MEQIIYVFVQVVYYILFAAQILMLIRAVSSIFMFDEESKLSNFLYYATEPLIYPVRLLFQKIGAFQDFIMDIPFMVTMLLIIVVQSALPTVIL